jgi:hypothetical protein
VTGHLDAAIVSDVQVHAHSTAAEPDIGRVAPVVGAREPAPILMIARRNRRMVGGLTPTAARPRSVARRVQMELAIAMSIVVAAAVLVARIPARLTPITRRPVASRGVDRRRATRSRVVRGRTAAGVAGARRGDHLPGGPAAAREQEGRHDRDP